MTDVTTSDGVRLYAEAAGSGPPILFIHEFAADHRAWTRQVEALSGEFQCITYSARGYRLRRSRWVRWVRWVRWQASGRNGARTR